jgi:ABC-2 type transport system ATP-binding protein
LGTVIQFQNVTKTYKGTRAVDHVNLSIEEGTIVALLGPNGAGKTTTVSLMLGLITPTAGTVQLLGGDPRRREIRDRIGAMLQEVSVMDGLKVREILDLFRSYYKKPLPLEQLLSISGLEKEANKKANSLSGGQKRRLAFGQALAGDPDILFLDEPTVGMDVESRRRFWETVRAFASRGKTILVTTHYLEEADNIADRIVVMDRGRIIADGSPAEIKAFATAKHISFDAGSEVTDEVLWSIPGVEKVERNGLRVKITGKHTDQILRNLILLNLDISDIEIRRGSLEEAFTSLTHSDGIFEKEGELNHESVYSAM